MGYSIYVVDDDDTLAYGIALSLKDEHHVTVFSEAESALKGFETEVPDLVLLDIGLPGMNGMDALRVIKDRYPGVAVIIVTGYEDVDTVSLARKLGAFDYVTKPLHMDALKRHVKNAFEFIQAKKVGGQYFHKENVIMRYEHIEAELSDGMGIITLNSPPLNIMNMAMLNEINAAIEEWLGVKSLRILVFNAKGKCFSAGVDVGEHMGDLAPKMIGVFHRMFRLLNKFEIPVLSSIYGTCLGGGCELAMFSDLVVAAESTKIGQPEVQVGVFPPIAAYIMPRIMGRKAAMDLILSGRIISAQEALQIGLLNRVVKDQELEKETEKLIKPYLNLSAEVLRKTKKAIVMGLMDEFEPSLKIIEEIYLNELMKTHDANEGLTAFVERRKPQWKNA